MIELLLAGDRLLEAGDLDRAERIYRQVAEADPRNAIAVVGLARVADARGARDQAVALAGRALAIDPDDLAAQRLGAELARPVPVLTDDVPTVGKRPVGAPSEGIPSEGLPGGGAPATPAVPAGPEPEVGRRSILARLRAFLGLDRG